MVARPGEGGKGRGRVGKGWVGRKWRGLEGGGKWRRMQRKGGRKRDGKEGRGKEGMKKGWYILKFLTTKNKILDTPLHVAIYGIKTVDFVIVIGLEPLVPVRRTFPFSLDTKEEEFGLVGPQKFFSL